MPEGYDILEAEEPAGYEVLEPEETPSPLPQEAASLLTERRLTPSETAKIASVRAQLEARGKPADFESPSLEPVMTPRERERIAAVRERVELSGYVRRITHPVQTGLTESAIGAAEAMRSPVGMGLLG